MSRESSRFAIALHALTLMAHFDRVLSSTVIAGSINTNPAWIRAALSGLSEGGLIRSVRGPSGGFALARPADEITLADIWRFSGETDFAIARLSSAPDPRCPVGGCMDAALAALSERATEVVRSELATITLAQWAADSPPARSGRRRGRPTRLSAR